MEFMEGFALGLFFCGGLMWPLLRTPNRTPELRRAITPFAKAANQMEGMPNSKIVYGQPLVGIGTIATVEDFKSAKSELEK